MKWPGVVATVAVTWFAQQLAPHTRAWGIGTAALALLIGLTLAQWLPRFLRPGIQWSGKWALVAAIALLGFRVPLGDLVGIGWLGLVLVGVAVMLPLLLAKSGPAFGVDAKTSTLIGTGIGVCGASAIAAAKPAVGANESQTATAIASVTLAGTAGLLVLPWLMLQDHVHMDVREFGVWMGLALPMVPQALGAALIGGGASAAAAATIHKLARVASLPLVVAGLAGNHRRIAPEVWLFLIGSLYATLIGLSQPGQLVVNRVGTNLLVLALAGLGLQTRFKDLGTSGLRAVLFATTLLAVLLAGILVLIRIGFAAA